MAATNSQKSVLLFDAIENDNESEFEKLVVDPDVDLNYKNKHDISLFHAAVLAENGLMIDELGQRGADPNTVSDVDETPLMAAIRLEQDAFVGYILDMESLKPEAHSGALTFAVERGDLELVEVLMTSGIEGDREKLLEIAQSLDEDIEDREALIKKFSS